MPPPKRLLHAAATQSATPPDTLPPHHAIAQVIRGAGNNLFEARLALDPTAAAAATTTTDSPTPGTTMTTVLVEMPARFRKAIWVRNGGYIVVDCAALNGARRNKLAGEIVNVVRGIDGWRKMDYWPTEFSKQAGACDESDDEVGDDAASSDEEPGRGGQGKNVGEMPPSEDEDEDEDRVQDSWRVARADVVYKTAEESRRSKR